MLLPEANRGDVSAATGFDFHFAESFSDAIELVFGAALNRRYCRALRHRSLMRSKTVWSMAMFALSLLAFAWWSSPKRAPQALAI